MKSTTDIWFAAFLMEIKNYPMKDYKITSKGRGRFFFSMTDEEWKVEKLAFHNSDISKIKQGQEKLKDLLY